MADIINNENVATEEELSEQRLIRREKLRVMQEAGNDPYAITKYDVTHTSKQAVALFEEKDTITVVGTDEKIEKLTKRLQ